MKFFAVNSRLITVRITFAFTEVYITDIAPAQGYSDKWSLIS